MTNDTKASKQLTEMSERSAVVRLLLVTLLRGSIGVALFLSLVILADEYFGLGTSFGRVLVLVATAFWIVFAMSELARTRQKYQQIQREHRPWLFRKPRDEVNDER
ncbi:hypothetical protein [Aliiroseovarius halocynthiae]|uniref:hypothetical protein n=1 Tax=Aliiroseovarius halocynthiae TaxID=985055 RepID=UPI00163D56DC|nr:hypothetical protein [Aliiroseovarius halocynthiae]